VNDVKQECGSEPSNSLKFTLRKVLDMRYGVVTCHGSRLICDLDVYNKNYELQQTLKELPCFKNGIHAWCVYDKEYILAGISHYYIAILRYDHLSNQYAYLK